MHVEVTPTVELHRRRQQQEQPVQQIGAGGVVHDHAAAHVPAGRIHLRLQCGPERRQPGRDQPEVTRHREQEQRQAEGDRDDQLAALVGQLGAPSRGLDIVRLGGIALRWRDHTIPGRLNRSLERAEIRDAWSVGDGRALGRQINAGIKHAIGLLQRLLHPIHARGAGHAGDREIKLVGDHTVAALLDRRDQVARLNLLRVVGDGGLLARQVDLRGLDAGDLLQAALDPAGARGTGHAGDRQGKVLCCHDVRLLGACISV